MASLSATCIRFGTSSVELSMRAYNQITTGKLSSFISSPAWARTSLSVRTSRLQICAAKPETLEKVSGIVRKQLALSPETQLTPETKFTEIGADSLDTVEIVMEFEEKFNISVEEENSENITTIQEAADLIDKLIEKKT